MGNRGTKGRIVRPLAVGAGRTSRPRSQERIPAAGQADGLPGFARPTGSLRLAVFAPLRLSALPGEDSRHRGTILLRSPLVSGQKKKTPRAANGHGALRGSVAASDLAAQAYFFFGWGFGFFGFLGSRLAAISSALGVGVSMPFAGTSAPAIHAMALSAVLRNWSCSQPMW